ncbi:DUF2147 domain-containing protein [Limnohabitans sp. INBF002]|uniref:DUF2147 domain-containing protein n=1 Tax=Limnohabitans sp. INBF002 TaxID=2986280 RepID=UPI0024930D9B|nr:DUF2147 domain-containing protein [Limnohabitans sp. INBF002]
MNTRILKTLAGLTLLAAGSSFAQMTPVGTWRNIDDKTGEAKAEIQIVEKEGELSGRIVKSLRNDPNAKKTCEDCKDDRKDQSILGMEIIRGVKSDASSEFLWAGGGKILDPENGKEYTVKMVPKEGGQKLQVRGYIGPFYRTQIWLRAQ